MADIILHHYYEQASPFCERVRLVLGLKGMSWQSTLAGYVPPRPHLDILAGGYRRVPVMQIGANVYCDSRCIIDELERRWPEPTIYPNGNRGLVEMLTTWAHGPMFVNIFCLFLGTDSDRIPSDYLEDRAKLSGPVFNVEHWKASVPTLRAQVRSQIDWIENQLSDGRPFLLGNFADLADLTLYPNLWYLEQVYSKWNNLSAEFPHLCGWMARVRALGRGRENVITPSAALEAARRCEPSTECEEQHSDPDTRPGQRVRVIRDDYAKTPIRGELVAATAQRIAIRRVTAEVGTLSLHFPRIGFAILPDN